MTTRTEVLNQVDAAAKAIATLPTITWWPWVLFFLDALDTHAQARGEHNVYTNLLRALRRDIDVRIAAGEW